MVTDLRKKNNEDLAKELAKNKEELRDLRFNLAAGKVKNVRVIHDTRKRVARIQTILNERE